MILKRAIRRINLKRMKRKALKIYPHDLTAKLANHLTACSCMGCSWGRRWHGPSVQERRSVLENLIEA